MGVHSTTVYQEIAKNNGKEHYNPAKADERAFYSKKASDYADKKNKLLNDKETQEKILRYLKQQLSSKVITGRAIKEGKPLPISHQSIYNFIYQHKIITVISTVHVKEEVARI